MCVDGEVEEDNNTGGAVVLMARCGVQAIGQSMWRGESALRYQPFDASPVVRV
jgi:hypothetical protein